MSLDLQFKTMLAMIIAGFCVGINFETFRHFTPYWYQQIILRYVLEILFWLIQTTLVFYVLYKINVGELRFYLFIAFFLGYSIYRALFVSVYRRLLLFLLQVGKRAYLFLSKLFHYTIKKPLLGLLTILAASLLFVVRLLMTPIFYLLQPFVRLLSSLEKRVQKLLPKSFFKKIYKFSTIYGIIKSTLKKFKSFLTF